MTTGSQEVIDGRFCRNRHDPRWPGGSRPDRSPVGRGHPSRRPKRRRAMDHPLTPKGADMHYNHYLLLALDTARDRAAEADRHRLAALACRDRQAAGASPRAVARIAVAVARLADEGTLEHSTTAS